MIQKFTAKIGEILKNLQGTPQGQELQNSIKKLISGMGQG